MPRAPIGIVAAMPKKAAAPEPLAAAAPPTAPTPSKHIATSADEAKIGRWKAAHITHKRAELEVKIARGEVSQIFDHEHVAIVESSLGSFSRQHKAGAVKIDWEAVARAGIAAKKLDALVEKHTTVGDAPAPVLAAPQSWGIEASS